MLTATQGCGFSDMIASLESKLRAMKMAHEEVTQDNKGCYNLIRAKDRELDAAAVHLEQARAVMVENKASPVNATCIECLIQSLHLSGEQHVFECLCSGSAGAQK